MSLATLTQDVHKEWLNARVNNLRVDGNFECTVLTIVETYEDLQKAVTAGFRHIYLVGSTPIVATSNLVLQSANNIEYCFYFYNTLNMGAFHIDLDNKNILIRFYGVGCSVPFAATAIYSLNYSPAGASTQLLLNPGVNAKIYADDLQINNQSTHPGTALTTVNIFQVYNRVGITGNNLGTAGNPDGLNLGNFCEINSCFFVNCFVTLQPTAGTQRMINCTFSNARFELLSGQGTHVVGNKFLNNGTGDIAAGCIDVINVANYKEVTFTFTDLGTTTRSSGNNYP